MKTQILEVLGETELNQPARIESALAANERIKYYLSLLQLAVARADHPEQGPDSMQRERVASGIDDRALDELLAHSQRENGHYILPGAGAVMEQIIQDFRLVAAPVLAQANSASAAFAERLERLLVKLAGAAQDVVESSTIAELTRAGAGDTDTLHQLLIDLHKA